MPADLPILPKCSPNSWTTVLLMSVPEHFHCSTSFTTWTSLPIWWVRDGRNGISLFTFYYPLGWEPFHVFFAHFDSFSVPVLCSVFYWSFGFVFPYWFPYLYFWIIVICWLYGLQKSVPSSWLIFNLIILFLLNKFYILKLLQCSSCFFHGLDFLASCLGNSALKLPEPCWYACLHFLLKLSKCWFLYIDL